MIRLLGKLREKYPDEDYKLEGQELVGKSRAIPLGNLLLRIKRPRRCRKN